MVEMMRFDELARKHETDKAGFHFRYGGGDSDTCHAYGQVYSKLFEGKEDKVTSVFEIGVHAGSSLRLFKEYFPNAFILGIDTNTECLRHKEHRIDVRIADQNSPAQLLKVVEGRKFDLIVDDGSHEREHQITSLKTLLPFVKVDGFYVIEDLGTAPDPAIFMPLYDCIGYNGHPENWQVGIHKIVGGLGPKVQPHEWLITFKRIAP